MEKDTNGLKVDVRKLPRIQSKTPNGGKQEGHTDIVERWIGSCDINRIRDLEEMKE